MASGQYCYGVNSIVNNTIELDYRHSVDMTQDAVFNCVNTITQSCNRHVLGIACITTFHSPLFHLLRNNIHF